MIEKSFEELILSIPNNEDGDGFYKTETDDKFLGFAETLTDKGFSEDEAIELLTDIYYAVANEYGD